MDQFEIGRQHREEIGGVMVAMTAIMVLADRATDTHSAVVRVGPLRERLNAKVDGVTTAAYMTEGVAMWAAAHPNEGVVPVRPHETGWAEYILRDTYHVRVQRWRRPDASPRRMSREVQGPDQFRSQLTLFDDFTPPVMDDLIALDLTATFGKSGLITGAHVLAPDGTGEPICEWDITESEVQFQIKRWRALLNTPWLSDIDRLAAVTIPSLPAASGFGLSAAPNPMEGRHFEATEDTLRPDDLGLPTAEEDTKEEDDGA